MGIIFLAFSFKLVNYCSGCHGTFILTSITPMNLMNIHFNVGLCVGLFTWLSTTSFRSFNHVRINHSATEYMSPEFAVKK